MINFTDELNAEQLDVVEHGDGPCLVLAGAGSGKTRTITYRVAYLLEKEIKPDVILLVTFTNKAAREMIARVQTITNGETRLPWSGTFHHIAFRILHRYAQLLNYKNNFTILDSEDSVDLMKLCLKQEGIDRKEKRFPSPSVLHSIISYARNAELSIEDVLDAKHHKWLEIADKIGRIAADYERRKKEANAMDFDDLLVNLYLLLIKSESVRRNYSEQFKYILVDEYQDTNKIQASIVRQFASVHKNILVVGDDAQSIYSFRAAQIENILSFEKDYPGAKIFKLETNYRSTPNILDVANDVIANNRDQYRKKLKSVREAFVKPEVRVFADQNEEAEFVAGRILELRDEGVPLDKMAVLFRAAFHSQALELELNKRDIPYDYRGGVRFFERAHVKDVLAYLRAFNNPEDSVAWSRVLNMQPGIGPVAAEGIINSIKQIYTSNKAQFGAVEGPHPRAPLVGEGLVLNALQGLGVALPSRAQIGWNEFLSVWQKMELVRDGSPADLTAAVINSKYAEYLEQEYPDYRERIQDLEQLANFADKRFAVEENNASEVLQKFLAEASLQESFSAKQARGVGASNDEEKIVLSTIHQAKGLEWDAVFIINLSAGQFPSDRSIREDNGIEEERRLFYVAVTRARKHLYMTYPLVGGFGSQLGGPSVFLEELNRNLIEETSYIGNGGSLFTDPSDGTDGIVYVSEDGPFSPSRPKKRSGFLSDVGDL